MSPALDLDDLPSITVFTDEHGAMALLVLRERSCGCAGGASTSPIPTEAHPARSSA